MKFRGPGAFCMGQHILDNFTSCFLDYRNLVRLVDILSWYSLSTLESMDISLQQKVGLDLFSPSQENAYRVMSLMLRLWKLTAVPS